MQYFWEISMIVIIRLCNVVCLSVILQLCDRVSLICCRTSLLTGRARVCLSPPLPVVPTVAHQPQLVRVCLGNITSRRSPRSRHLICETSRLSAHTRVGHIRVCWGWSHDGRVWTWLGSPWRLADPCPSFILVYMAFRCPSCFSDHTFGINVMECPCVVV